jgi:hypothetical protein
MIIDEFDMIFEHIFFSGRQPYERIAVFAAKPDIVVTA